MANKENMRKWVDALRSGKYPQTRDVLTRVDSEGNITGHCCLGVLCEISGVVEKSLDLKNGYVKYDGLATMPTSAVREDWLGHYVLEIAISPSTFEKLGMKAPSSNVVAVQNLNDEYKFSFDQIADLLEAEYLQE